MRIILIHYFLVNLGSRKPSCYDSPKGKWGLELQVQAEYRGCLWTGVCGPEGPRGVQTLLFDGFTVQDASATFPFRDILG